MPPPYEPDGSPQATGQSEDGATSWVRWEDGTTIQTSGDTKIYVYPTPIPAGDRAIKQYSEMSGGDTITSYDNGDREQFFSQNGTRLEAFGVPRPTDDGEMMEKVQHNQDGSRMEIFVGGRQLFTSADGSTTTEVLPVANFVFDLSLIHI
eukprot:TRINITY_DN11095_c0_g1_i16.p1 TRINITY_DN11095_c0_g1~~TRINITY_DN11095_c0_g1_i16.p1  ORF type:complete len:150 (+),score=44.35 TRINITY_DN11095_c0_g1_i16:206-655(+)